MTNTSTELITYNTFGEIKVTRKSVTVVASAMTRKGERYAEALYDFPEDEVGEIEEGQIASAIFAAYVKPNGEFLANFQDTGDYHPTCYVGNLPQVTKAMAQTLKTLLKKATSS